MQQETQSVKRPRLHGIPSGFDYYLQTYPTLTAIDDFVRDGMKRYPNMKLTEIKEFAKAIAYQTHLRKHLASKAAQAEWDKEHR